MQKPTPLITGEIYHIYSKSIYGYKIFNRPRDYIRMLSLIQYYQWDFSVPFCHFLKSNQTQQLGFQTSLIVSSAQKKKIIQLIAYCIMKTHIHFILKQTVDNGISQFINKVFGGYSLYFNLLRNRRGPLWQSRFGRRHIDGLGDLISTSHYLHANPVEAKIVTSPRAWEYSSYAEYCENIPPSDCLCQWQDVMPIHSLDYQDSMTQYLFNRGE